MEAAWTSFVLNDVNNIAKEMSRPSTAATGTLYVDIAAADLASLWCDWTQVAWQGLHMVGKNRGWQQLIIE